MRVCFKNIPQFFEDLEAGVGASRSKQILQAKKRKRQNSAIKFDSLGQVDINLTH
jgi:hypothetical protein